MAWPSSEGRGIGQDHEEKISWSAYIDKNIKYVRLAVLGTGVLGLYYIGRSIRLTQKFETISSIPEEFFTKNFKLYGLVRNVSPVRRVNSLDMVDVELSVEHIPILRLPKVIHATLPKFDKLLKGNDNVKRSQPLVIRLPGVKIHRRYFDTIQIRCISKRTKIILLEKCDDEENQHIVAQVFMLEQGRLIPRSADLGHLIIENGYGSVTPNTENAKLFRCSIFENYYARLLKLEETAASKKLGIWSDSYLEDSRRSSGSTGLVRKLVKYVQDVFYKQAKGK